MKIMAAINVPGWNGGLNGMEKDTAFQTSIHRSIKNTFECTNFTINWLINGSHAKDWYIDKYIPQIRGKIKKKIQCSYIDSDNTNELLEKFYPTILEHHKLLHDSMIFLG